VRLTDCLLARLSRRYSFRLGFVPILAAGWFVRSLWRKTRAAYTESGMAEPIVNPKMRVVGRESV